MEALYAPPDHPVFELVPPAFHEHVSNLYAAIGRPEVTIETFWDIFCNLLECLHEVPKEQLTKITACYNATHEQDSDDMALLPDMDAFHPGQPLNLRPNANYIGGLDGSVFTNSTEAGPVPEFADFTEEDETDEEEEGDIDEEGSEANI